MPTNTYNRISNEDRVRLINAFEDPDGDYKDLARTLDINVETARSIIRSYLKTSRRHKKPRGGSHNCKVDGEIRLALQSIIEEEPLLTLNQINHELRQRLPEKPVIDISTISKTLQGMLITLKLSQDVVTARNSDPVLTRRKDYAGWLLQTGIHGKLVYLDECGFNLWTKRSFGRSLRGTRVPRVVNNQRGSNVMVTLATSPTHGLIHSEIRVGSVNRETFKVFISGLCFKISEMFGNEQVFIIMDNARPHMRPSLPEESENISIIYLPPYSPFLNPVEHAISCYKAAIKRIISQQNWQSSITLAAAQEAGVPLTTYRLNRLTEVANECLTEITVIKCLHWYNHTYSFLTRCINKEHVLL